ncbi:MAG: 4'-phosphopantetheinyl transferase [Myxococcota bacterium]
MGRWLVRTALSRHAARAPQDWRFVSNQYGAPAIVDAQQDDAKLRFNLSHTRGLVAVVVAREIAVGVDVEHTERRARLAVIARRFFAPSEVEALLALDEAGHRDRFFAYWTLKEAYIKARGMGLAIPLGQFFFDVDRRPITIGFDPRLDDDPARWHFELSDPYPDHRLAVAVASNGHPVDIQVHWT